MPVKSHCCCIGRRCVVIPKLFHHPKVYNGSAGVGHNAVLIDPIAFNVEIDRTTGCSLDDDVVVVGGGGDDGK